MTSVARDGRLEGHGRRWPRVPARSPLREIRRGAPALELDGLVVTYPGRQAVRALDGISLAIHAGECLGVLGESGSGKSTLAKAALGLLSEATVGGRIRLGDIDLHLLDEAGWRGVRWRRIAMSFQSTASLNPVLRIGTQLAEPLQIHLGMNRDQAELRVKELLDEVGLGAWAARRYPGELSGGQRRLVLLSLALACRPEVVILDEPTAGLDPATRSRVIELLARIRLESQTALVVLSHDADALEAIADRVAVFYRGWLAEIGPSQQVLADPRSPYTWALLNARPTLASVKDLRGIRGAPPDPTEVVTGCPFFGRCHQGRVDVCASSRPTLSPPAGEEGARLISCARGGLATLVAATGLRKSYPNGGSLLRRVRLTAVDDVTLSVREGEVVGLVGSTGAGKSTLGMLLVRLLDADGGTVTFDGVPLLTARGAELKALRTRMQMLFQDPFESLSPRLTVGQVVREPLDVQGVGDVDRREAIVRSTVAECRLPVDDAFLARHTHELSGGQLQRVALARALILEPTLLVADEALSMLDPSEQAEMLQLLKRLQVQRGMSMVFISHDLGVVLRIADRVLVLDGGRVVEEGSGSTLLMSARHPVTRMLLGASGRDLLFSANGIDPDQRNDELDDVELGSQGGHR